MNRMIIEWLRPFLQGSRLEPEQVLWGLLICTFVLSTLHLVTLFATRWGDRRITGKALAFSVLLHGAIAISIITVAPAPGIPQGGGEDDEEHRVTIRGVTSDVETAETNGQNSANKGGIGQTPVWDQLPPDKGVKPVAPTPHTPAVMPPPRLLAPSKRSPR